jgi:hypothetical protein
MSWVAAAIGGSAVLGAGASYLSSKNQSDAAKDAAKYQLEGADLAAVLQQEQYDQSREDMAPWREAGTRGLESLERVQGTYEGAVMDPSKYEKSPGYNWLQEQGINAVNRGSAASGMSGTGRNSKDLMQYGQGLALQDYQGYLGRLESLMNRYSGTAQVGQTASNTLAGLGANAANQMGAYSIYGGQAQAGSEINQANARTSMYQNFSNIGSNAINQGITGNYLQNMGQSSGSTGQGYSTGPYNAGQSAGYR